MKTVDLICGCCNRNFKKAIKEYNRQTKNGRGIFYCSKSCASQLNKLDEFSPFRVYLKNARKISKQKGYKFDLELNFLKQVFEKQKGCCAYTGVKLDIGNDSNDRPFSLNAASLDRIDSSKGYTKDNVEFVCLFVNLGKNGFSKKEVKDFLGQWQI